MEWGSQVKRRQASQDSHNSIKHVINLEKDRWVNRSPKRYHLICEILTYVKLGFDCGWSSERSTTKTYRHMVFGNGLTVNFELGVPGFYTALHSTLLHFFQVLWPWPTFSLLWSSTSNHLLWIQSRTSLATDLFISRPPTSHLFLRSLFQPFLHWILGWRCRSKTSCRIVWADAWISKRITVL